MTTEALPVTDPVQADRPVSRGSMAVAAFSTIVEWYDFTLSLYLATVLSRVFFGAMIAVVALLVLPVLA